DLVFKKPLVRLHWKSQRSSRSHSRLLLFRGALPLAPAGIEDQLNELHLNPPAQNSPHAIVPDAKAATPEIAPAAESEGSATAEALELPSAVEGPSPAAYSEDRDVRCIPRSRHAHRRPQCPLSARPDEEVWLLR